MLTDEAMRNRKWGNLPALRKMLESEPIPERYCGLTSVSDTVFQSLQRAAEIAVVATENENRICEQVAPNEIKMVCEDLERLTHMLRGASNFFTEHAERMEHLHKELRVRMERMRQPTDSLAKTRELYQRLMDTQFACIQRGEHELQQIYAVIKKTYPDLCDDSLICADVCREGNQYPEWQHKVRAALGHSERVNHASHGRWLFK
jgi:hypothetical protein